FVCLFFVFFCFFFFQAEDGIRDLTETGVQTCALPIWQVSAGIVTSNGPGTSFLNHKDMGLVSQVFGQAELEQLKGSRAIGHTRRSEERRVGKECRSRWSAYH